MMQQPHRNNIVSPVIGFCMKNRIVVVLMTVIAISWGLMVAPFDWPLGGIWRDPIPVDAIPDIGENQQIVFTEWSGRSPQDVEDQITYPLSVSLLGIPGVRTTRSYSMFGFSMVYVIFNDNIDFYWSRSRILERLNSLPERSLPTEVQPRLGPDATALGQIYWYTLEGYSSDGTVVGGWDLHELRSIQDWYVRYALMSVPGVSEVASVGGFVQEYQIDVDPDRMRYRNVRLEEVVDAVRRANVDVGARTLEVNKVEYVVRGLGFIKDRQSIENSLIKLNDGTPILVRHVANVTLGPAARRGALVKGGSEAVGGVVVVRHGENPMEVIQRVKSKIEEISLGLPKRTLAGGRVSQVKIVPFYDRTDLIHETLATLQDALSLEILITIVVVLFMMMHLRSALLISGILPLAVLLCFVAMKVFKVDANIVALSGIAIAIGTIVDMGIIVTENIHQHLKHAALHESRTAIIQRAVQEVSGAVVTAVATTIIGFLPVFAMEAAEGKLFRPLAFTKTFALFASLIVALVVIPVLANMVIKRRAGSARFRRYGFEVLIYIGAVAAFWWSWALGLWIGILGAIHLAKPKVPERYGAGLRYASHGWVALGVVLILASVWAPVGLDRGWMANALFVLLAIGGILGGLRLFQHYYRPILSWCLDHKAQFIALPVIMVLLGVTVWLGADRAFGWLPRFVRDSGPVSLAARYFPGLDKEFMPVLDEGSYLYMPVTMPHASIGEVLDVLEYQDQALRDIPEVEQVVGKLGRAESPLDPAPISMIETVIGYHDEFLTDNRGRLQRYKFDARPKDLFRDAQGHPLPAPDGQPYYVRGRFERDDDGLLIPDRNGKPFRLWRPAVTTDLNPDRRAWPGIQKADDIWKQIVQAANVVGTTVAPKLQPISARLVMLQSGIRASMGVKIYGPDLEAIAAASTDIERQLRRLPAIAPQSVIADRVVGKPYLEIDIDREAIAQYGIDLQRVQDVIETAIGGKHIDTTVQGRERYPVRVRYMRELRDHLDSLGRVLVTAPDNTHIPLMQLAKIRYSRGPQVIKGENAFLVGYVLFDKRMELSESRAVAEAKTHLNNMIDSGELILPPGVSFSFVGNYENQVRAEKKLHIILPLALLLIFMILCLQFKSMLTSLLVFSGVVVAWSGGFILLWLYAQPWFLDFSIFGTSMRQIFQVHPIHLSVAVWVGFLALFGIASDDGVVMATYLNNRFARADATTVEQVRNATIEASMRRLRPCLMTTATTILALLPVLTSTGRGSDIMVPMAIPTFGGMALEIVTMLVVPVLYCAIKERQLSAGSADGRQPAAVPSNSSQL
jgi:Cu(I)/Ag(I) efflux system membrane protein CusA/SilA